MSGQQICEKIVHWNDTVSALQREVAAALKEDGRCSEQTNVALALAHMQNSSGHVISLNVMLKHLSFDAMDKSFEVALKGYHEQLQEMQRRPDQGEGGKDEGESGGEGQAG